jgi:putative oxidoreductase
MITHLLYRVAQWGLAALLLVAGALKLRDPAQFGSDLENYQLLSTAWTQRAGFFIPWLEIAAAIGLLVRPLRLGGWALSVVLGLGFTVFVSSAWARGLDISCGCFGSSHTPVGPLAATRAALILLITLAGFWRATREEEDRL